MHAFNHRQARRTHGCPALALRTAVPLVSARAGGRATPLIAADRPCRASVAISSQPQADFDYKKMLDSLMHDTSQLEK